MARTTAEEMAEQAGVDPRVFRRALRDANFPWHVQWERWTVEVGSEQHQAMEHVLQTLTRDQSSHSIPPATRS